MTKRNVYYDYTFKRIPRSTLHRLKKQRVRLPEQTTNSLSVPEANVDDLEFSSWPFPEVVNIFPPADNNRDSPQLSPPPLPSNPRSQQSESLNSENVDANNHNLSLQESVVLVQALASKHNLTKSAIEDLLNVISLHHPSDLEYPTTIYKFNQFLGTGSTWHVRHFFCEHCEELLHDLTCPICAEKYNIQDLVRNNNFFFTLDLRKQFECVLENRSVKSYVENELRERKDKTNAHNMSLMDYDLTCTWSADAAPVFMRSSKTSLWTLSFYINELPYFLRKKLILVGALWCSKKKVNHNIVLPLFVNQANDLIDHPIKWKLKDGGGVESRIFYTQCTADSVERCLLQGHRQFNGEGGCGWCMHTGKQIKKNKGTCRVYCPILDGDQPPLRTETDYRNSVMNMNFAGGIKTASPILLLRHFQIVTGFSVDVMHCVYLGVSRTFFYSWTTFNVTTPTVEDAGEGTSSYVAKQKPDPVPWYITKKRRSDISKRLLEIKAPSEIGRTPRSLVEVKYWKASEWRSWLFVLPVILKNILPEKYLKHFCILSSTIYTLNLHTVSAEQLNECQENLAHFVREVPRLYGEEYCTFNVHQLLHICHTVSLYGPLWNTSAFPFESFYGKLLSYKKSATGVLNQISSKYEVEIKLLLDERQGFLRGKKGLLSNPDYKCRKPFHDLSIDDQSLVSYINYINSFCNVGTIKQCKSAFLDHHIFKSKCTTKHDDTVIYIEPNKLGRVCNFFLATCSCPGSSSENTSCQCICEFVVLEVLHVILLENTTHIYYCHSSTNGERNCFRLKDFKAVKFYSVTVDDYCYFIRLPNLLEIDN